MFDFDGTLADTFPWFSRHVGEASERFKFRRVDPRDVPLLREKSAREVIEYLGIPCWKIPLIARHLRKAMSLDAGSIQLFSGIGAELHELKTSGLTLAIVSSNLEENVRAILGPELAGLFSVYECGSSLFGKARRFKRVLARTGLLPGETICVGDEIRDHEAARSVGLAFGGVSWGYTASGTLKAMTPAMMFETVDGMARGILSQ